MNVVPVALVERLGLPGWATHGLLLVIVVLVAVLVAQIGLAVLRRVAGRTQVGWDDAWVSALANPLRLGLVAALLHVSVVQLGFSAKVESGLALALRATELLALFWGLYRGVEVIGRTAAKSTWAAENPSSAALITLGGRVVGIAVLAGAVITLLSTFGLPVGSLVAGAGLGGLAIGLAAQKSIENLFGGFSLAIDRPCRAGDFVRVEDFVGTVEDVGIRSTRIRTLDRTLITIPNARLSETRIETFAARDRIRLACTLGVEYGTSQAQMREVLEGLRRVLLAHPQIWTENVIVRFIGFGASSLDIEVMAWFVTTDWNEFLAIREQVLLEFMGVVEQAKTGFAFPTRTIHIASNAAKPG